MLKKNFFSRLRRLISSPSLIAYHLKKMTLEKWWRRIKYELDWSKPYYPKSIILLPTARCNLNCISCNIGLRNLEKSVKQAFEKKKEIGIDEWRSIVDKISFFNPMISVSGGEPFLYPGTINLIEYIKKKGLYCSVSTNATTLKKSDIQRIVDSGLDMLTVSIDGIGEVHDQIRGMKGTFEKAVSKLGKIIAYKKELKRSYPILHINCVMSPLNQGRLEDVAEFFTNFGVDSLNFSHIWFYNQEMVELQNTLYSNTLFEIKETLGGKFGAEKQGERNLGELWNKISAIKEKYKGFNISFLPDLKSFEELEIYYQSPITPIGNDAKCYAPWKAIEIYSNGDAEFSGACFHIYVGNFLKQSFNDVWNSDSYISIRKKMKEVGAFPICSRCCYIFQEL